MRGGIKIQINNSTLTAIKNALDELIDDAFQGEMKKTAHDYADYHEKTNLPFGRLCASHHHLLGGKNPAVFQVAASIELVILAFNILDDWQDQDNHQPPWMQDQTGQPLTVETGLLLSALSVLSKHLGNAKNQRAFQLIMDQMNRSVHGQFIDIRNEPLSEKEYLAEIEQKSGALSSLACLSGVMLADSSCDLSLVEQYATKIGICAQLQNDLEDVLYLDEKNDLIHKKRTLATMYLADHPSRIGRAVTDYFKNRLTLDQLSDIKSLDAWIQSSGVILYTNVIIETEKLKAERIIERLPVDEMIKRQIKSFFYGLNAEINLSRGN